MKRLRRVIKEGIIIGMKFNRIWNEIGVTTENGWVRGREQTRFFPYVTGKKGKKEVEGNNQWESEPNGRGRSNYIFSRKK